MLASSRPASVHPRRRARAQCEAARSLASFFMLRSHQYSRIAPTRPTAASVSPRRDRAADRHVHVVDVGAHSSAAAELLRAEQVRSGSLREPQGSSGVPTPQLLGLARVREPVPPVLPDGLEHPVPRAVAVLPHDKQRLVGQRGEQVEHVLGRDQRGGVANTVPANTVLANPAQTCSAASSVRAAGENGQPPQQRPLGVIEQVPAPVDDRPQRLMARQRGPAPARQQPEPVGRAGRRSAPASWRGSARRRARWPGASRRAPGRRGTPRGVPGGKLEPGGDRPPPLSNNATEEYDPAPAARSGGSQAARPATAPRRRC